MSQKKKEAFFKDNFCQDMKGASWPDLYLQSFQGQPLHSQFEVKKKSPALAINRP